jgi:hypothetical protein
MEMSACRETPETLSWKEKQTAQNGKSQPHAALYASIILYISGICGIFWNVLCFAFCFTQFFHFIGV